jgi:two-component system, sensor histidine kinase
LILSVKIRQKYKIVEDNTVDYKRAFEALPGSFYIVEPNAPVFTILSVSEELLKSTGKKREELEGKGIFEVFPENPVDEQSKGPSIFRHSLQKVIQTKLSDTLPMLRYDVANTDGVFEERYWIPVNKPVLDKQKSLLFILHYTTEVTDKIIGERKEREAKERNLDSVAAEKEVALNKIIERESMFRSMVEQTPVAITLTRGKELLIESINQPMAHMMGKEKCADLIGKKLLHVLPELESQPVYGIVMKILETGESFNGYEIPVSIQKGEKLEQGYFNISYTPLIAEGVISGVLHVAIDVTEQVLSRQKLEESEQQLRSIIESSPYPIGVYVGKDMRTLYANQALKDALGKGNHIIGKPYKELMWEFESQDVLGQIGQVFTSGIPLHIKNQQFEVNIEGNVKTYYYNYSFIPLLNAADEVYGIVNTAVDVTDLVVAQQEAKESEERFRSLANDVPVFIFMSEHDIHVSFFNRTWLEFTGLTYEEAIARGWEKVTHPDYLETITKIYDEAYTSRKPYSIEVKHKRKDGEYRWVLWTGIPRSLPNGEFAGFMGTGIDIHDRKQAENSVLSKNEQLIQINNDLDTFIYTASHDLKAPISNLEGLLHAFTAEYEFNKEQQELINMMFNSVERFKNTIKDLTEIGKIQRADQEVSQSLTFSEILNEVTLDIRELIDQFNPFIETQFEVPEIRYSKKNLRSIFYNLISNSLKYSSPDRAIKIGISTKRIDKYILLEVADNGLGLSTENQKKIFGMFKRAHQHIEGSGIGLYMIKRLIENSGGKIEFKSEEGKETAFKVFLPA